MTEVLTTAIATRGRAAVIERQQETWLMFGLLLDTDPDFRAEVERARAGRQEAIVRDRAVIQRAATELALTPKEAAILFQRTQGRP